MPTNKVDAFGKNLIDLTSDTVKESDLPKGVTAHNAKGERIVGTDGTNQKMYENGINLGVENGYDGDTFYIFRSTIGLMQDMFRHIVIASPLGLYTNTPWSTHSSKGTSFFYDVFIQGGGWGATHGNTFIRCRTSKWTTGAYPIAVAQDTASSKAILYLRGGARYRVLTDWDTEWEETEPYQGLNNQDFRTFTNDNPPSIHYGCELYGTISNATKDAQNNIIHQTYAKKDGTRKIHYTSNGEITNVTMGDLIIVNTNYTMTNIEYCDIYVTNNATLTITGGGLIDRFRTIHIDSGKVIVSDSGAPVEIEKLIVYGNGEFIGTSKASIRDLSTHGQTKTIRCANLYGSINFVSLNVNPAVIANSISANLCGSSFYSGWFQVLVGGYIYTATGPKELTL